MPSPPRCAVRDHRPRDAALRLARGRTCLKLRLAPARPIGVLFLLQRSCLASALTRRPVTARRLWVFAVVWPPERARHSPRRPRSPLPPNPRARRPPFPGAAPGVAAIPRTASMATIDAAGRAQLSMATEGPLRDGDRPHT